MKKFYNLLFFIFVLNVAKAQFPAPYCAEAYSLNQEPITSVVFGSISNTSDPTTGVAGSDLEDYTSLTTDLVVGGTYSIAVQGNTDGSYSDYVRVFIDWNQNGDFTDAGESYDIGVIYNSTGVDGVTATANILVPQSALLGNTRMRVTKHYSSYQNPCNTSGFGQSEDYTVNVIAASACTGVPVAGNVSAPAQACSGLNFVLSLNGSTVASGIHYQWQSTTTGSSNWVNTSTADTTTIISVLQGIVSKNFRCMVVCDAAPTTPAYSDTVTVAIQTANCPPPNDDICNAITLVLDGPSDCQNTANATSINDPSSFSCSTPNNTTWYKYTPTNSGNIMFNLTTPATGDPLYGWLGVFTTTGTCPGPQTFTDVTSTVLGSCKSYGSTTGSVTNFLANLNAGTDYYFMVDGVGGDTGHYCISIITPPTPPSSCATNLLPADQAIDVSVPSTKLKWDTVAGATSYTVYLGKTNPPTTVSGTYTVDSTIVNGLLYNTTYYWYVVPKNGGGAATGCDATNTTSFTTNAPPPPPVSCATNILPVDQSIDIPATTTFKWDTVSLATSYDLYIGTTNPPTTLKGTYNVDSALVGGLSYSTQYYWYVVPKNGGGSVTGCDATNTTSFTTMAPPPPPLNDDCTGAFTVTNGVPLLATTVSATQSQAAEICGIYTGTADDDVWFTFTATQAGSVTITETPPSGSSLDGVIMVYTGDCNTLVNVGCADATFGGQAETVNINGLNAGDVYYFRVYSYGSGTTTQGDFVITVSGSALPIALTKFTGEKRGSTNILSWTTANETNNIGFELQRSATGDNFLPLTFVNSKATYGNSAAVINYQATDIKPYSSNTYYRLKQIDKNGNTNFSNVIVIKGEKINNLTVSDVFPNPANKLLNMIVASPSDYKVNIIVTDIAGKVLKQQATQLIAGNNNLKLDVSTLASGSYILKVVCKNGCNSGVVKFVKE